MNVLKDNMKVDGARKEDTAGVQIGRGDLWESS